MQDGRRLIVAVYGAKTAKERAEEARKLLQWGFRNFEEKELFKAGETVGPAQVYGGAQGSVELTLADATSRCCCRAARAKSSPARSSMRGR